MGNYITSAILEERVTSTRLSSLCIVTGASKAALIESIIARAEAVVDGYASTRNATPLPDSDLVREWTLCVAEYELYKRGPGESVPEKIRESYKDAISQLKSLAAGEIEVPSSTPANSSGASFAISSRDELFDSSSMGGF